MKSNSVISNLIKSIQNNLPLSLLLILIIGLIVRLIGIWHGLPLQINIDEPAMISRVLGLKSSLNPGAFDWPHLYYYMNAPFYAIFGVIRSVTDSFISYPPILLGPSMFFLISRVITAVLGVLTIFVVYLIGKEMFGKTQGLIASLIMAILPIHVLESRYAKTDVAQTFFSAISLYFIYRLFQTNLKRYYIWAGIFIGLSASIKYGGVLMFFPLLLAFGLSVPWKKWFTKDSIYKLFLSGIFAVLAFVITTPFSVLDFEKFISTERAVGAVWQIQNVGNVEWVEYPIELYETFVEMYPENIGFGLYIVLVFLIILFIFFNKRRKEYVILLLPFIVFSLYISRFQRSPDHYFIFLAPMYVVALAGFLYEIYEFLLLHLTKNRLVPKDIRNKKAIKILTLITFGIILIPTLFNTIQTTVIYARQDTRKMVYDWVQKNISQSEDLIYIYGEDFETISFRPQNTERIKRVDRGSIENDEYSYLIIGTKYPLDMDEFFIEDRYKDVIRGNYRPILQTATLEYIVENNYRNGPSVYVFRIIPFPEE